MKKIIFIILVLPIFCYSQTVEHKEAAEKYRNTVVLLTKYHLPLMYQKVIDENYCGPDCYRSYVGTGKNKRYVPWNMKVSEEIVYRKMCTIIHESTHGFNKGPYRHTSYGDGDAKFLKFSGRILVSLDEYIDYEGKEVIKSYEIVDETIGENPNISDLFRFDTYVNVGEDGNISSNVSGIYGMMDEFSAYYHGCNAAFMIYNDLKEENVMQYYDWEKDDGSTYDTLIMENVNLTTIAALACMGQYSSYYEFNIFIGAYLKYIKEHHPVIYSELLDNQELRRAYSIINRNFNKLVIRMDKEFGNGFKSHKDSGITYGSNDNAILGKSIMPYYYDVLSDFDILEQVKL